MNKHVDHLIPYQSKAVIEKIDESATRKSESVIELSESRLRSNHKSTLSGIHANPTSEKVDVLWIEEAENLANVDEEDDTLDPSEAVDEG